MNPTNEHSELHAMHMAPTEPLRLHDDGASDGLRTIVLSPWGEVPSTNGVYVMDDEATADIVAAFKKHGTALPIDREHETLPEREPANGPRGAVGWIEDVWAESGRGLMGKVKWTDEGRALIRSDAFRYLSPVLMVRKSDRRAVSLHSAALTNKPAIPKMERLAASQGTNILIHPVPAEVASAVWDENPDALALAGRVSESPDSVEAALADVRTLVERMSLSQLGRALPLLRALAPESDETAEVVALKEQVAALELKERERHGQAMIDEAVRGAKLSPNSKRFGDLRKLAMNRPELAELVIDLLPVYPPQGQTTAPHVPESNDRTETLRDIRRAYFASRTTQRLTSLVDFVNSELRVRKLDPLKGSELEEVERLAATARP